MGRVIAASEHWGRVPREALLADAQARKSAVRTAFIARFIVLREGRRTKAHRIIERLTWSEETSAAELAQMIRQAFIDNGDKMGPVDRDIRRALDHAESSVNFFIAQYLQRETLSFLDALADYERSNELLFGEDEEEEAPLRTGGWRSRQALLHDAHVR